jgi:hypothetical protein
MNNKFRLTKKTDNGEVEKKYKTLKYTKAFAAISKLIINYNFEKNFLIYYNFFLEQVLCLFDVQDFAVIILLIKVLRHHKIKRIIS